MDINSDEWKKIMSNVAALNVYAKLLPVEAAITEMTKLHEVRMQMLEHITTTIKKGDGSNSVKLYCEAYKFLADSHR